MKKFSLLFLCFVIIFSVFSISSTVYAEDATVNPNLIDGLDPNAPRNVLPIDVLEDMMSTYALTPSDQARLRISDNPATAYFSNLRTNYPENVIGSCGYTALAMLLSYYDTTYNDNLIPEEYDVESEEVDAGYTGNNMILRKNSPGVTKDNIAIPDELPNAEAKYTYYYNEMYERLDSSLHARLLYIGESLGYRWIGENLWDEGPGTVNMFQIKVLLINYLNSYLGLNSSDYSISNLSMIPLTNGSNVRDFTIEKVEQGIPVLLGIQREYRKSDGTLGHAGHFVIAYDYDSSTDELYCHFGWNSNNIYKMPEDYNYLTYMSALAISFNDSFPAAPSNNYIVNGVAYDFYDDEIITVHEHSYDDHYTSVNNYTHNSYCECGLFVVNNHTLSGTTCTKCNATHTHVYDQWAKHTSTHHIEACACGAKGTATASHVTRLPAAGATYTNCLHCGQLINLKDNFVMVPGANNTKVTLNGSYILPNGIIVLVDEDIEAYFNGTLVFYDKDDLPVTE